MDEKIKKKVIKYLLNRRYGETLDSIIKTVGGDVLFELLDKHGGETVRFPAQALKIAKVSVLNELLSEGMTKLEALESLELPENYCAYKRALYNVRHSLKGGQQ